MKLKRHTWHHQLYTFLDRHMYNGDTNVCKYIRGVTTGAILALLLSIVLAAFSLVLLDPIVSALAYWITGISFVSFFGVAFGSILMPLSAGFAIYVAFSVFLIGFGIYHGYHYILQKAKPSYTDSKLNTFTDVVYAKIKSKHDKICHNIEFTNR